MFSHCASVCLYVCLSLILFWRLGSSIPWVRNSQDSTPFGSKPHSQGTPRTMHVCNPNHNPGNSVCWEWWAGTVSTVSMICVDWFSPVLYLLTADGNCEIGHCEPVHCCSRSVAGDDGWLLADGLGTKVIADRHVDDRVGTRSGQVSPILAGAVCRRHAVWWLHSHCRQGGHHTAICFPRLQTCKSTVHPLGCWSTAPHAVVLALMREHYCCVYLYMLCRLMYWCMLLIYTKQLPVSMLWIYDV